MHASIIESDRRTFSKGDGYRWRFGDACWAMETGWMAKDTFVESRTVCVRGVNKRLRMDRRIWDGLAEICQREYLTMDELITQAADINPDRPLKAVLETLAVVYYWEAAEMSLDDDDDDRSALEITPKRRYH